VNGGKLVGVRNAYYKYYMLLEQCSRCNSASIVSTTGLTTEESGCDIRREQLTYSDASGSLPGLYPMAKRAFIQGDKA
jgi:hypothetical protein